MRAFASICNSLLRVAAKNAVLVLGLAAGLSLCLPAHAQLNLAGITGAITDQTGGAIVGATVNVIDVARGISRPLVSDSAGEYAAPSLTPGTYTVHIEAMGFKTVDRQDILLQVGQNVRVDIVLQPGQQDQTITVTGDLPMIDTSSAQLGSVLENLSVEELPVNGRNYQYMLEDRPGMVQARAGGPGAFTGNGNPSNAIAWMFDGLFDGNIYASGASVVGGGNQGPDQPSILPLDSIQEVSIIQVPKAEYGWRSGNHINVGLKSGTNNLHGTAYAFGRDTDLNAKNPFLLSTEPKAPTAVEQFGASINGPFKKDKLFYFANYEGQRYSVGVPTLAHEPTTADLTGTTGASSNSIPDAVYDILHNGNNYAGGVFVPGTQPIKAPSALSLNLAGCAALAPAGSVNSSGVLTPTRVLALQAMTPSQLAAGCSAAASLFGSNGGTSTTYVDDFVGKGDSNNGIIKIDYHPNDHNSFNAEWFTGGSPFTVPGNAVEPYWVGSVYEYANAVRGVWIWTPNSSWVNDFRFGYEYENLPVYNLECQKPGIGPDYSSLGFIAGNFPCPGLSNPVYGGFPATTVSGFGNLGSTQGIFQDETEHYFAINDSISYTRGKHVFKFGGEVRFDFFEGEGSAGERGVLSFGTVAPFTGASPLQDFMAGVPSTGEVIVGQPFDSYYFNQYAGFVQDDWRVLSRLTLNLGLRYEYTGSLWAVGNHMGNFQPSAPGVGPTGLIQQTASKNVYAPSPLDFAPRVGLAWDVTGKGTTVVRASFNLLYSTTITLNNLISSAGSYLQGIPTGFTFYNQNGSTFAGPGDIKSGAVNLATNQLPWLVNVPVFNASQTNALQCGDGVAPVNPVAGAPAAEPAPCYLQAINPNIGHYGQAYYRTLGIQHAFTNNLSVNISYVGNHGAHIMGVENINSPTPGAKNTAANGYIEQARRPYNAEYPFYGVINYETDFQGSNYNSLQTSLTQRVARGVNFTAAYTLAHYLDNATIPLVANNPRLDYGNASADVRNYFTFTMTYMVPGRKSFAQLLQGWEVNTTATLQSGFPLNATDTTNDLSGTGQLNDRWTMVGPAGNLNRMIGRPGPVPCFGVTGSSFGKTPNCANIAIPAGAAIGTLAYVQNMPAACVAAATAEPTNASVTGANATGLYSLASFGCYMSGSTVIVPPAQGTFGTMGRDALYYEGFHNWNISATKTWRFKERYGVQFRADFFNVLNRTSYAAPSSNLASPSTFGESQSTPDASNFVIGNGPRKIQLGLKLSF